MILKRRSWTTDMSRLASREAAMNIPSGTDEAGTRGAKSEKA